MKELRYVWVNVLQTLLRMLPFPCSTGLMKIGNPGRDAPVLLTCNFGLTVERIKRVLEGLDVYLLVANSRGVNVWCAATGGLMTDHDVVSVLKTSGIEKFVDHRRVTLPQLAATGIDGHAIQKKTGWRIDWGPVDATEIPAYLRAGSEATREMRSVRFPWPERLEMAVAWAFPLSLLAFLLFPFWQQGVLPVMGIVWGLSLSIFLSFPLYQARLGQSDRQLGFVFFDFGRHGLPLLLWMIFMLGLVLTLGLAGNLSWAPVLRWGLCSLVVLLILCLDLMGSTPVYKSGLHDDRLLKITLDEELCKGAGFCETVCPTNVFEVDYGRRMATLPRAAQCVQCGACIVQCPFDALYFGTPTGERVTPDTIRRFKLNLMGKRLVRVERNESSTTDHPDA